MRALGHPGGLRVTVADGDVVSESNIVRQPFSIHQVGKNKAVELVTGINRWWGLNWSAHPHYLTVKDHLDFDIVVGCVDTRAARAMLAKTTNASAAVRYWLDAGNGPDFGQIILGEPQVAIKPNALRLPTVAELLPETVDESIVDTTPSCSAFEALTRQAPGTNHVIAQHMFFLLGQLFRLGQLDHHGLFLNLASGIVQPIPVDPKQWELMMTSVPAPKRRGKMNRPSTTRPRATRRRAAHR